MNKLIYIDGDAVKALQNNEVDFLMHCVNMQGVMSNSISKQIKTTFPIVYDRYKEYCNKNLQNLGDIIVVDKVISIFVQETEKPQLHYGALVKSLNTISKRLTFVPSYSKKYTKIAVPKLMCCDWEIVQEMLESLPGYTKIIVYNFN